MIPGYQLLQEAGQSVTYEVLFEDCEDPVVTVNAKEMMGMLDDTLYLPA